ncbi:tigger transposable element-derived protein 1 [Nephila pilipes]|uniref:Tigger transposable element-derived protein 1 n=1 Tax=Nephila pilipes TaxID=299642 RepID=A0A8X6MV03_NEPPI|nr:tigger transposable element-derived protein 1 [Nephila pilipes]
MDRKKVCEKSSAKKKMMSIELKREIIEKHEQGVRVVDLSRQYGRSTSMICTVLKQKESIKSVTEKQLQGDTLTQTIICEKARAIYGDLLKQTPQTSIDEASEESFKASRGWFENFKKRTGIHSIVRHSEEASSDMKAAEDYIKTFSNLIKAQGYISQQVFNCDETGLFWKKMMNRTYITAEEMMPGHKPMKDRLTLVLCDNASVDCKIKPLLVYHSENPRAFKSHKILKEKLQVMWKSNPKAWVTRKFFVEWVNLVFGPSVKKYLQEKNLPVQALLILDNAPAHPPNLEDDILEEFKFIKVLYLPPNTTPILQPMDQQGISNFKKLYTKHLFRRCFEAWLGVTTRTLTSAWKKLWPEAVAERIYEELEPGMSVEEEIVSLGKSMGLEVEERDVNELVEEHTQELTTEEIQELQSQQQTEIMQEIGFEESEEEVISTSEIKEILEMWERVSQFVEKKHPEKVATCRASDLFNDTCLTHFRNILRGRKKQTSLDMFFSKRPTGESEKNVAKKAKTSEDI